MHTSAFSSDLPSSFRNPGARVQFLVRLLRPGQIFGIPGTSARFLAVLPDNRTELFTEPEPYLEYYTGKGKPAGCLLAQAGKLQEQLQQGHVFYSRVCQPANLLYTTGGRVLPQLPAAPRHRLCDEACYDFFELFLKSCHFYDGLRYYYRQQDMQHMSMFMLHQSAELALRALVHTFSTYYRHTHQVRLLKGQACRYLPGLSALFSADPAEEEHLLQLLDDAYLDTRYQNDYKVEPQTMNVLIKQIQSLHLLLNGAFTAWVHALRRGERAKQGTKR